MEVLLSGNSNGLISWSYSDGGRYDLKLISQYIFFYSFYRDGISELKE